MPIRFHRHCAILCLFAALEGCSSASLSVDQVSGLEPLLAPPAGGILPVVKLAPAEGWNAGEAPLPAEGLTVQAFAAELEHPRWLYVLPNGDVLVAETNAPPDNEGRNPFMKWVVGLVRKVIGTAMPSPDRITLLRDADGDGVAERRFAFLEGLTSPFGMTLVDGSLYVANTGALLRFPYHEGALRIEAPGERVLELPAGDLNYHWTRNVIASPDGERLYVTIGSNSNIGENGLENEEGRARVLEVDRAGGEAEVFAWGLRNPNGLAWEPESGELWATVNERDGLGSDVPPDYMTALRRGGFYGWPWSWWGRHVDRRVTPERPDLVDQALTPDYALGPHTSSMGLAFYTGDLLPARYRGGAFVGQHGSWNRRPRSGYRVVFVPFDNGEPAGLPEDVLTGFIDEGGAARGRPVGVAQAADGALLVADDVGNTVWRISPTAPRRDARYDRQ